jgi:Domain of unknown function (DUF4166)/Saccharopine dehydrogenase NADP binding domain
MTAPFPAAKMRTALGRAARDERRVKVLILGGYGTFGGRLVRLLADESTLTLLIAGRSHEKAAAFCAGLAAKAECRPLVFDRDTDVGAQLARTAPDVIVDASGPFQSYGDDPYRVVKAALALGISYLDLADGAAFVRGIQQFDAAARARGIFVLAGVSSLPVLTAAAVRQLAQGLERVETITAGIAPSPYAGVGPNVIRAICGYAGKPVALVRDGRPAFGYALMESRRYTIAPPSRLPLRNIRFSLVDTPDLQLLPALWPDLRAVWIGVGPVPAVMHRMLSALAWLVRLKLVPSLAAAAGLFHRTFNLLRWGEHRGGMFVAVTGATLSGQKIERSWHLLAEGNDGPFIPAMTAEAIIRRCLQGRPPAAGARPAVADLELADYEPLFARHAVFHGFRETIPEGRTMPLYRRILGDAWSLLPPPIQRMHDLQDRLVAEGRAAVDRGRNPLGRLIATLVGFPKPGRDLPVQVAFERRGEVEAWRRTFAGRSFTSVHSAGSRRSEHLIVERFGPFAFGMAAVLADGGLRLVLRRWSFLGLPLPLRLAPGGEAYEFAADGRFHFHVELGHPLTGLIVRYRGWLAPPAEPRPAP